jgi:hypothetical protein
MVETVARKFVDQAATFLETGLSLESAWTVVTHLKRIVEIGKEMKYSRPGMYHCAEVTIRAQQRLGAIIELIEAGHSDAPKYGPATVKSLKISKLGVSLCKSLVDIPEDDLQRYFERIEKEKRSLTAATVIRQREEDPVRGIFDAIQMMAACGDEEGAAQALRDLQNMFPAEQPAPEPMPRTPDQEDIHRMRGMGIKWND